MSEQTAIVYVRVSSKEQTKGYSLGDQVKACHQFAAANNLKIVGDMWVSRVNGLPVHRDDPDAILGYCDAGVSGTLRNRPALNSAISFLANYPFDFVIAQDTDRFSRDPEAFYHIASDMKQTNPNIGFGFVGGIAQGLNPDVLLLSMALGMAKKEIDKTKQRSVSRKAEKARRGLFGEGYYSCPMGYRIDTDHPNSVGGLVIVEGEAEIVRHLYRLYDDGSSLSGIVKWLLEYGIPTHRGKAQWTPQVIRRLLTQPTYKGVHVSKIGGEIIEKRCPQIVDEELWERVNAVRERNRSHNRKRASTGREYLLGEGRLRCADCGHSYGAECVPKGRRGYANDYLLYRHRNRPNDTYGYGGCRNDYIHSKYLEPAVWEEILSVLADPQRIRDSYSAYIEQFQAENAELVGLQASCSRELADLQHRLDNLILGFEGGGIRLDELKDRREQIDARIQQLRLELRRLEVQIGREPGRETIEALEVFAAQVSGLLVAGEFTKEVKIKILRLLNVEVHIKPRMTEEGKVWDARITGYFPTRELSLQQQQ